MGGSEIDPYGSGYRQLDGYCEHCHEYSGSIKCDFFCSWNFSLLKRSVP
jgi:hypothetical protein